MAGPKGKITLEFSGKDAGLAQSVANVTKAIGNLTNALNTLHPKGQRNPFKSMMTNASKVATDIKNLNGHVRGLTNAFAQMNSKGSTNSFRTMATNAGSMNSAMQQATTTLKTFSAALQAVRVHGAALRAPTAQATRNTAAMGAAAVAASASMRGMSATMAGFGRAMRSAFGAAGGGGGRIISGIGRAIGGLGGPIRGAIGWVNKLAASFLKLFASIRGGISNFLRLDNHIKSTITNTRGLVGHVNNMNSEIIRFASGIRQIGQAMQNMGMTMSVFLSYPISRQLQNATGVAMDFQHAMVEVRKNTGAANPVIAALSREMQDMVAGLDGGPGTPTDIIDLAGMAADAARFGIPVENLVETVRLLDQAIVSTDLSAQDGVESVARFMGMFVDFSDVGYMANEFERDLRGVLSAVNELGQANPVGEQEIIDASLRIAPTAGQLGFNMQDVLGIATTVASVNASPERAGSQFAAMLTSMVKNSEELAGFIGMTHDEFAAMVEENPEQAIMSIVAGMKSIPGVLEQAKVNNEAFGQVGGKAASSMLNAWDMLVQNQTLSNEEFAKATSITLEFMRALDSVENQVGLLKNQFNVLGIALGEAFLPVITQILSYVIPAMRVLIEYFRGLSDSTKLWIVGIAALVAILGPLLFIMGSLAFSIGILITGFASLFTVFFSLVTLPGRLIAGLFGLIGGFGALATAVGVAVLVLGSLHGAFGAVGAFISTFVGNMYTWGAKMMTSFGQGILDAGVAVYNAVVSVINGIVGLLQAFSPPKEGPLKNIDTWGANIATTFADAFALGDLTGVEKFAQYIGETLTNQLGGMGAKAMELFDQVSSTFEEMVASFAKASGLDGEDSDLFGTSALSGLVDVIRAIQDGSGNLDSIFSNLGQYLGPFFEQFKSLLGLQLSYNEELEKQKSIQEELDDLDRKTNARVIAVAMDRTKSVAERVSGIRSIRRGSAMRRSELENQLETSKKRSDELNREIEALKGVSNAFKRFMPDLAAAMGGLSSSMDNLADKFERAEQKSPKDTLLDQLTGNMQENLFPEIGDKAFGYAAEYREELSKVYDDYIAKGMTAEQATIATSDAAEVLLNNLRLMNGLDPLSRFDPEKALKDKLGGAGSEPSLLEQLAGGGAGGLGLDGAGGGILADFEETTGAIADSADGFVQTMVGKGAEIKGFFAGVTGKPKESLIFDTEAEKIAADNAYAIGESIRARFTAITSEIQKGWDASGAAFEKFKSAIEAFVVGTQVGLGEMIAPTDKQLANLTAVEKILYSMGTALGVLTAGTISVGTFINDLFRGSDASSWDRISRGILSFRDAFVQAFVLDGGLSRAANTGEIIKGLVSPLVQLASLAFDNLGSVGDFLGLVASQATNLAAGAAAVSLLVSSLMGANNATVSGPLQNILTSMSDGKFKDTIQEALKLGNPSDPVGKQVVDFINGSIRDADWGSIGGTIAGFVNKIIVGEEGTGGIVGALEGAPIKEILGGIVDAITKFTGDLKLGNFAQRIGDILGGILSELTVENVRGITDTLGDGILGIGKSKAIPGIVDAANAIITGIVESLADLFANEDFAPTLSGLATAILEGIVDLPWATAAAGLGDLARAILGAIADAPWGEVAEQAIDIIKSLVGELAKPETIGAAAEAITSFASGLIFAIVDALSELNSTEDFPGIIPWGLDMATVILDAIASGLKATAPDWFQTMAGWNTPEPQDPLSLDPSLDIYGNPRTNTSGSRVLNSDGTITQRPLTAENASNGVTPDVGFGLVLLEKLDQLLFGGGMFGDNPNNNAVGMGLAGATHGDWVNPYTNPSATSTAAAPTLPATADAESIEPYMLSLQQQFATWMSTNAVSFFSPLYTGIGQFIGASLDAIMAMMTVYGNQLSVGFAAWAETNYATMYAPLGTWLMVWIMENAAAFNAAGESIGQHIITGINTKMGVTDYWNVISTSFQGFVASVSAGHPMMNAADSLGGRIIQRLALSITEGSSRIGDAVDSVVTGALNAAASAAATPAPLMDFGGVGSNAKGTNRWKGGLTWLHEEGPELVDLPAGSRVHNTTDSSAMLAAAYSQGLDNSYTSLAWRSIGMDQEKSDAGGGPQAHFFGIATGMTKIIKRLDQNIQNGAVGGATVVIQGDVIVDSKKRMDDLAEEVSRRIGKNMRMNR